MQHHTYLNAIRYFGPNFSNSAITQSVMHGMPSESSITGARYQIIAYTLHKGSPSSLRRALICFASWNWWSWYQSIPGMVEQAQCCVARTVMKPLGSYWENGVRDSLGEHGRNHIHPPHRLLLGLSLLFCLLRLILFPTWSIHIQAEASVGKGKKRVSKVS